MHSDMNWVHSEKMFSLSDRFIGTNEQPWYSRAASSSSKRVRLDEIPR